MSQTPSPTIDITLIGTADGHERCCAADPPKFICGAPFHPEVEAAEDDPHVNCPVCAKTRKDFTCQLGHHHCPLMPGAPECP